ncbi:putative slender lobes protein [Operophtera brumata]|uniref:Putative slender lobes protein n=1 Tax=Operophtera brumata TaxID=104452 RepID=A0A0L7LPF6_OPEBR|nr:putative slender lobes protein [Operophtera brumata]
MAWLNLNQSFNSLKGQITTFATEVLSEAPEQDTVDRAPHPESSLSELQAKCHNQELEVSFHVKNCITLVS